MGKYFEKVINPTVPITTVGSLTDFTDNDVLFDWLEFTMPRGTKRLLAATIQTIPKPASGFAVNDKSIDLIFAIPGPSQVAGSSISNNNTAPISLGTLNSAVSADVFNGKKIIQFIPNKAFGGGVAEAHLDSNSLLTTQSFNPSEDGDSLFNYPCMFPDGGLVPNDPHRSKYYVTGIAAGTFDFRTDCVVNQSANLDGSVLTVSTRDPLQFVTPGDTIIMEGASGSSSLDLGVVKSIDSTTQITFTTPVLNNIVDTKKIGVKSPITIRLYFEE